MSLGRWISEEDVTISKDHFPDPVGHLGAAWRPLWIFEVLIGGMMESKKLI